MNFLSFLVTCWGHSEQWRAQNGLWSEFTDAYKDFEKALRDERVTQGCKGGCQILRGLNLSRKATFSLNQFSAKFISSCPPPHMGLAKVEACCVNGNDESNPGKRALLWFNVTGSYITVSSSDQFSLDEICVEASYWRTHQKINIFL